MFGHLVNGAQTNYPRLRGKCKIWTYHFKDIFLVLNWDKVYNFCRKEVLNRASSK